MDLVHVCLFVFPPITQSYSTTAWSPMRQLHGDSAPLSVINTAVTRNRKEVHSRGGGRDQSAKTNPPKKIQEKNPKEKTVWTQVPPCRHVLDLVFKHWLLVIGVHVGPEFRRGCLEVMRSPEALFSERRHVIFWKSESKSRMGEGRRSSKLSFCCLG